MFAILTERKTPEHGLLSGYWSQATGLFSAPRMANKYKSPEAAKPTLEWLRQECCEDTRLEIVAYK